MRLAELIAPGELIDAVGEAEVVEPGRLGNVEMIDGMQIVVEARQRRFFRAEPSAVFQPAIHEQHVEWLRHVGAQHEAVMPCANDDAIVGLVQRCRHAIDRLPYFAGSLIELGPAGNP